MSWKSINSIEETTTSNNWVRPGFQTHVAEKQDVQAFISGFAAPKTGKRVKGKTQQAVHVEHVADSAEANPFPCKA